MDAPDRAPARLVIALGCFAASFVAGRWGYSIASTSIEAGPIWRQVLASLLAYKAFLAVIAVAWAWRGMRFR